MEQLVKLRSMDRKPIFDAVRIILGRGFVKAEVEMIDRAIDRALGRQPADSDGLSCHRLGALSERFESGGRGPGAVSGGRGDPGGVSYGIYQLASITGTAAAFVAAEGARWQGCFGGAGPGSAAFSAAWQAIAAREPEAFAAAQHAFIERSHYRPVVAEVLRRTGLDLDARPPALRDAAWSVAVQHGGAAKILAAGIARTDARLPRNDPGYDRALLEAVYAERGDYVARLSRRGSPAVRRTLESVIRNRYPAELATALAMLADAPAAG